MNNGAKESTDEIDAVNFQSEDAPDVSFVSDQEDSAAQIFAATGLKFDPETAALLWSRILQHKWVLSERLGRDVGLKLACIDFIENIDPVTKDARDSKRIQCLREFGAQVIDRAVWETISDSQPPKQVVNNRIIRTLQKADLARKHGVTPPRAIIFFGPPGTGKTHFVKAIAGILQWWYIEISPSVLMEDGQDRLGANLKKIMEKVYDLDETVVFIDEFEEIAGSRDHASRVDKSITNEFLKQVPLLKARNRKNLLICATNYIRQLDAALLRPGRFDCIIPVGSLDEQGRKTIFEHYIERTNCGTVDLDRLVSLTPLFTPADIEYLFQKVRQYAFEQELKLQHDYLVTTETFLEILPSLRPTLTEEIITEFQEDCAEYTRV
ncbi:ATP-binding protein [Desulfonatronum sp. SC1]|uniref:ATP-binding protein n=1 Tax=Desulfonatronum sp. SC1 TaxID=2109626 RepID=UPI000D316867|nr:ATP-binding protein [Desulfonatronum sp. SC1]PTN37542.1 AAA family ATPase [Desulfonatronum sp. SC1]